MATKSNNEQSLVMSYLALRTTIGLLGAALPFVLFLGALLIFNTGIQSSISSYYYTGMRNLFVGTLCVVGFFLLSYHGYERADDIAGTLACIFAVGIAFFPTAPDGPVSSEARLISTVHLTFAALFFLTLIYFSLFLFTKTNPRKRPTPRKLQRNKVYRTCGVVMAICILLIAVHALLPADVATSLRAYHPVFWLEAAADVAFGVSWLTKGEAILKDEA